MNHSRNTIVTVYLNILTILVCLGLFIGSTFAWYTASITVQGNKIKMGILDMTVKNQAGIELSATAGNADLTEPVLFKNISWRPGTVAYENLTIQNSGNLTLDYSIDLNVKDFNWMSDGDEDNTNNKSLKDVIKVALLEQHIEISADITEPEAVNAAVLAIAESVTWMSIDDFAYESNVMESSSEAKKFAVVFYWEPSGEQSLYNDNDYNSALHTTNDGNQLYLKMGITFEASQVEEY
ncbi:MAG: hypothetical protein IKA09_04565 [Lachnospiraceae bacterium]|nr:hypothetical protein [Lachnospiraceae bacterium]